MRLGWGIDNLLRQIFDKNEFTNNFFVQTLLEPQLSARCAEAGEISPVERPIREGYQLVPTKSKLISIVSKSIKIVLTLAIFKPQNMKQNKRSIKI